MVGALIIAISWDDPTKECAIFYWAKLKYKPEIHQLIQSKML